MTPERLAATEQQARAYSEMGCVCLTCDCATLLDLIAHIRDLEAQVREEQSRMGEVLRWLVDAGVGYDFTIDGIPEWMFEEFAEIYAELDGVDVKDHLWTLKEEWAATATPLSPEVGA